jgi:DNA gyrase subunit A
LHEQDELVFCSLSSGSSSIVIATAKGQGIRFNEGEVRSMGRQAAGVIGIRLRKNDYVVGMEVVDDGGDILFATLHGYGKKVAIVDFRVAHRGGIGVRTIPTDARNGAVIGLATVQENSNILLIDQAGKIIRLPATEVRTMGRQAKGVRLIRLDEDQLLARIVSFEDHSEEDSGDNETTPALGGDSTQKPFQSVASLHDDDFQLMASGSGDDEQEVEGDKDAEEQFFV